MIYGKTQDCALSCNAFTLKYVPIDDRLHMAFPGFRSSLFILSGSVNLCEGRKKIGIFKQINFAFFTIYGKFA